jgi:exoribonuclease-2
VRADELPLVFKALGCEALPRGAAVRVRITGTDEMTLDVFANLIERLDAQQQAAPDTEDEDLEESGPLTLAIDMTVNDDIDSSATPEVAST